MAEGKKIINYIVLSPIEHNKKNYAVDKIITSDEIKDNEAERLISLGVLKIVTDEELKAKTKEKA
jgi:hypothetical protein